MEALASCTGPTCLLGFGELWVSSPMGSFESTDTPWQEWSRENQFSEITDAYGSFLQPAGGPEGAGGAARGGDFRRYELPAYAQGEPYPFGGLGLPEVDISEVPEYFNSSWDQENLYDQSDTPWNAEYCGSSSDEEDN